ncbi:MAG: sulfotransferase [Pirellulales bacterium]
MPPEIRHPGIAILGFPRSGTTLLRRLLDGHSQIDSPGESYLLSACARFIQGDRVVDGVEAGVLGGLELLGTSREEMFARLRRLVFEIRDERARRVGKTRWVEKTAVDAFHLDAIQRIFGNELTYVCVVRHGLDVCVSTLEWCQRLESFPADLHRYIARYPQPLVAVAHAWVDVMQSFERLLEPGEKRIYLLQYERLVGSPGDVLRELLAHLGETWEEGLLDPAQVARPHDGFGDWKAYGRQSVDNVSVGRWRSLADGTVRQLAPIVNPTLVRWGYDPIPSEGEFSQAVALRRYELSLLAQRAKLGARGPADAASTADPPTSSR